jgi:PAT family beta-lactamase induction signal transducer AmpG
MLKRWKDYLAVYGDRRILTILLLGFSSGLPLALTGGTLAIWLSTSGVSIAAVGLFSLVGLPYSLKFLWAPIFDRTDIPGLSRLLGRRRSWMVVVQVILGVSIATLGTTNPVEAPAMVALLALITAFCSASQDVVIDAYRVEILESDQQGAGAAAVQLGYRMAMMTSGAGALFLTAILPWGAVYGIMAALVGVGLVTVLLSREPVTPARPANEKPESAAGWLEETFLGPFKDMLARNGWSLIAILAFVVLYKFGDAFAGVMANPFYVSIGFSTTEIASVSKVFGVIAALAGTLVGGIMVARIGVIQSLLISGVLQALSNLMFAVQAGVGPDVLLLSATIGIENFTGGMGSAAFVAYISGLCSLSYTGSQYALLSALATVARTSLGSPTGYFVEAVGWVNFFLLSTLAALPGLLLLLWIIRRFPVGAEGLSQRT